MVAARALWTEGKGLTIPLLWITPMTNLSFPLGRVLRTSLSPFQGIGRHWGSSLQGSLFTTALANNSREEKSKDIGPLTDLTASWPASAVLALWVGNLPKEGFREYRAVKPEGIRTVEGKPDGDRVSKHSHLLYYQRLEPPTSVPTPRGDPRKARSADSPPEEPPEVQDRLWGLTGVRRFVIEINKDNKKRVACMNHY